MYLSSLFFNRRTGKIDKTQTRRRNITHILVLKISRALTGSGVKFVLSALSLSLCDESFWIFPMATRSHHHRQQHNYVSIRSGRTPLPTLKYWVSYSIQENFYASMILHLIRRAVRFFVGHSSEGDGYRAIVGSIIAVIPGGTLYHHAHPMPYPFPRVSIVAAPTVPIVLHLYFHHLCHPTSSTLPSSAAVSAGLFMCRPHHP